MIKTMFMQHGFWKNLIYIVQRRRKMLKQNLGYGQDINIMVRVGPLILLFLEETALKLANKRKLKDVVKKKVKFKWTIMMIKRSQRNVHLVTRKDLKSIPLRLISRLDGKRMNLVYS